MDSVVCYRRTLQVTYVLAWFFGVAMLLIAFSARSYAAEGENPARSTLPVPDAEASLSSEMKEYIELVEHTDGKINMLPIPGGQFLLGSPANEKERKSDEGPQHQVKVDPFWMSKFEMTWDVYEVWMFDLDVQRRKLKNIKPNNRDISADEYQISQPTEPYTDMTFGMGKRNYPAICMTHLAATTFCHWLSAKTGRYYRLPTEAEWEYACRAGANTAYHFGNDPQMLGDYAWHYDNSDEKYHKVGLKKPNSWGLHDMHGNVAEWVLDQYTTDFYAKSKGLVVNNPLAIPTTLYPRIVRGGSWDDDRDMLRCAARSQSTEDWKLQDPQIPKSIWYHTDALHVGFRIIRPLHEPSAEERKVKWDNRLPLQNRKAGR